MSQSLLSYYTHENDDNNNNKNQQKNPKQKQLRDIELLWCMCRVQTSNLNNVISVQIT